MPAALRALADQLPLDPEVLAAELKRLADKASDPKRRGGEASAKARAATMAGTRKHSLALAQGFRRVDPALDQAAVVQGLIRVQGGLLPGAKAVARWVRAWELEGKLQRKRTSNAHAPIMDNGRGIVSA